MKAISTINKHSNVEEGRVAVCLSFLGNKWTGLILSELTSGSKRFTEIERALPGISPRTLSQRLEELVSHKILTKKHFAESPPRIEYTLTDKGRDFIPVLQQMATWGSKYS